MAIVEAKEQALRKFALPAVAGLVGTAAAVFLTGKQKARSSANDVNRGIGDLTYDLAATPQPSVVIIVKPHVDPPPEVMERYPCFTIPMVSEKVRSLNLATAAGIVLYEGLRQLNEW